MKYLPIFLRTVSLNIYVIGGGLIAASKLKAIKAICFSITLITNPICSNPKVRVSCSNICWLIKRPEDISLNNSCLVVLAKNDIILYKLANKPILNNPRLLNIVDSIKSCSFIYPSIINRCPIIISICSFNRSPTITKHIRNKLKSTIPLVTNLIIDKLSSWRTKLTIKKDNNKKAFWVFI
ncbi:precorrin-2 dehydrogenase/sirohydrochlorin ferrochelatase family protein [Candidatus Tremblaya phenacola]|uniref:precorrin-2 dehydrogenase n=1 Tax=Candidatus Tremblayella phenacoccinincola TaxID=1010676 RepID=A0A2G0V726_9PROT|nr:NAD(P)-dependent oxidoreductase [Candidatus Tremblaya phenacola]PHN16267.1 Siroheme synthase, N-terminal domain [Candidatus Tremblaya phenacola]